MSGKIKFSSTTSTPKSKVSETSAVSSPTKISKYKNFLASVLTPSQTKKWLNKKSGKSSESFKGSNTGLEEIYKGSQISSDFCEPGYSSIQDLRMKSTSPTINSSLNLKTTHSVVDGVASDCHLGYPEKSSVDTKEPIYSTVNKKKKNKVLEIDSSLHEQSIEKTDSEYTLYEDSNPANEDILNKRLVEEQKEEIKLLVERLKELTNENRELHKNVETFIKEEKWKEDSVHTKLKYKVSQLEADTHKKVKCLSDQIETLHKERKVLTEQIHILYEENKLLKLKYEDASSKVRLMVSPESLKELIDEHETSMNQIKKKHLEEIKKLKKENEMLRDSKMTLTTEVDDLKEQVEHLINKNGGLRNEEQKILQEKNRILLQLDESKQMQEEAENMLLSLLKIAETISIERDVLLNKSSFQEHQQKLLQATMMDYTLNMGRLQEHISILNQEKLEELGKLKSGESERGEKLKNMYGTQLDLLHSKVLNQSNTINDLESEKSKLQLQIERLWQAACVEKPKVGDVLYDT